MSSTLDDVARPPLARGPVLVRRVFLAVLVLFVIAGASGLLGVHSHTSVASGGGYRLEVRHAAVARSGLDVPLEITVRHEGGFPKELTLRITGDYFDMFETQGFLPEPSDSTRAADAVFLTFTAPQGDVFVLHYDAYIEPSHQRGSSATVAVVDDGQVVTSVSFHTMLLP